MNLPDIYYLSDEQRMKLWVDREAYNDCMEILETADPVKDNTDLTNWMVLSILRMNGFMSREEYRSIIK